MRSVAHGATVCLTVLALGMPPSAMAGRTPAGGPSSEQAAARGTLKVVIVDGDEAANVVQEKMAAESVIEVRDDEDRTVAGAVVRFKIRRAVSQRLSAAFRGGKDEVRALTDAAGQARTGPLTPLEAGRFEIEVQATHQGQTGTATIRHTNFSSSAQARAAGREPVQSTTAAAGGGAAAAVAGGGMGLGKIALIGVAVGGAGAGAAVYANSRKDSGAAATVSAITLSQTTGVLAVTPFRFSVQATSFAAGTTYRWEFGDGEVSTEATPTHVYNAAGSFGVTATVSDGRQSATSQSSVTVYSLSGTWVAPERFTTLQLTQSGASVSGSGTIDDYSCSIVGSVQVGSPVATFTRQACSRPPFAPLIPAEYRLDLSADGRSLNGTFTRFTSAGPIGTDPITLRRP